MIHAEFSTLFALAEGALEPGKRERLESHLTGCVRCRVASQEARTLLETVRSDRMISPPARAVAQALAHWREAHPGPVARALRVLKAALVFDSLTSPLPATVRGQAVAAARPPRRHEGPPSSPRHILFRAEEYDLDIAVEAGPTTGRGGRKVWLRGQVLGQEPLSGLAGGATARLKKRPSRGAQGKSPARRSAARHETRSEAAASSLDEQGSFAMGPIDPGKYTLTVDCGGVRLVVDRLDVM